MRTLRRRVGRIWLSVDEGESPVVYVHDPGAPRHHREDGISRARKAWGAWTYAQRGHAPSGWAKGQFYRTSDLAIDLVLLLREVVAQPCVLAGEGAGGLVAMLAAAVAPELVDGIHLLPGSPGGWGADPSRVITEDGALNPMWLTAVRFGPGPDLRTGSGDDPILAHGPAERMHRPALLAVAAQVTAPWSAAGSHFLDACLPAAIRSATPLL